MGFEDRMANAGTMQPSLGTRMSDLPLLAVGLPQTSFTCPWDPPKVVVTDSGEVAEAVEAAQEGPVV